MVFSLAACSSSNNGGEEGGSETTEKTKITIWGTWTDAQYDALVKYAADFTASQDKYEVVYEGQVYQGFSGTLQSAVTSKVGPDIVIDYASTAATYNEMGLVADLSKYVSADTIAQLTDGALEEATSFLDGGMYNFPVVLSGPVIWYNPAILEAAGVSVPTTWKEVWETSKKISETVTVVTGEDGSKTYVTDGSGQHIYGFASDSHTDFAQTMIMQLGGDLYDTEAGVATFNTEDVAEYLTDYQNGILDGSLLSGATTDYLSTDFNSGIVAMYFGSVAGEPYLSETHKAAAVPGVEGGVAWTPAWNRGVLIFNYGDEERIKGAAAFLEYFVSAEINEDWCEKCNYQSCLKWTMALDSYQTFLAGSESLQALSPETAGAFPAIPAQSAIRTALKNLISSVGAGTNVNDALAEAVQYIADNK